MGEARCRDKNFTPDEIEKVTRLLKETDMPMSVIGIRFGNKEHLVVRLNKELNIRPQQKNLGIKKPKVRKRIDPAPITKNFLS